MRRELTRDQREREGARGAGQRRTAGRGPPQDASKPTPVNYLYTHLHQYIDRGTQVSAEGITQDGTAIPLFPPDSAYTAPPPPPPPPRIHGSTTYTIKATEYLEMSSHI